MIGKKWNHAPPTWVAWNSGLSGPAGLGGAGDFVSPVALLGRPSGTGEAGMARSSVSTRLLSAASKIWILPEVPTLGGLAKVRTRWVSGLTFAAPEAGNSLVAAAHGVARSARARVAFARVVSIRFSRIRTTSGSRH
jgi:hypothetical protein